MTLELTGCRNLSGTLAGLRPCVATGLEVLEVSSAFDLGGDLADLFGPLRDAAPAPRLRSLVLDACLRLEGTLHCLARCANLETLSLDRCHALEGALDPLASCGALASLRLGECARLTGDLQPLAKCSTLRDLDLRQCAFVGGLAPLDALGRLRVVDVSGVDARPVLGLAGPIPRRLLARVSRLDLSFCLEVDGVLDAVALRGPTVVLVEPTRAAHDRDRAAAADSVLREEAHRAQVAFDRADAKARRQLAKRRDEEALARAKDDADAAVREAKRSERDAAERLVGAEIISDSLADREAGAY